MNDLPIDSILPELNQALSLNKNVILSAQPGAGKTTRVPLALLDAKWLRNDDGSYKKIIMLEPRRLAARNAALFMAKSLGENIGQTVGYRMRQDTKVSVNTRIEVITEGILTRYLLDDPELSDIGLIIFDEHHERSVNTDLGLALSLQCQQLFREDLKLLVMSATLDKQSLETLLTAKTLFCPGRSYPIEHHYLGFNTQKRLCDQATYAINNALQKNDGNLLVFLPGVRDILQVQQKLNQDISDNSIQVFPLYGQLSDKEQQLAIKPAEKGQRKIVLSTNIAESSLTIEGIRIVIDCGLEKQLTYNPRSGMNALVTQKISQASSIQRAGRAGRLEPGVCYRLWSEQEQSSLQAHAPAEITRIELSDLTLNIAQWGADIKELDWLTVPPDVYIKQSQRLLQSLNLLDGKNQITKHGEHASQLGLNPRFAHMLLIAPESMLKDVTLLASMITDTPKALRQHDDLQRALQQLKNNIKQHPSQKRQAEVWSLKVKNTYHTSSPQLTSNWSLAQLLASAFPDRIAKKRNHHDNQYLLSSGRGAELYRDSTLCREEWLIVSDIEDNQQGSSTIRKAMAISEAEILELFEDQITYKDKIEWNAKGQLIAEEQKCLGALILKRQKLNNLSDEQWQNAWINYLADNGISVLPWNPETSQLLSRLQVAYQYQKDSSNPWPDFSLEALSQDIESWIIPLIQDCRSIKALKNIDLKTALLNRLGWSRQTEFESLVPEKIQVPSGSNYKIDYSQSPPILAVKLQEMFGYQGKPSICNGTVNLMLHLLSPAKRPLQITQDLPYFWENSYFEVRKEMRGHYPKHPWPENPMDARATHLTKKKAGL